MTLCPRRLPISILYNFFQQNLIFKSKLVWLGFLLVLSSLRIASMYHYQKQMSALGNRSAELFIKIQQCIRCEEALWCDAMRSKIHRGISRDHKQWQWAHVINLMLRIESILDWSWPNQNQNRNQKPKLFK